MKKNNTHDSGYWTKDRCKKEANKYASRCEFQDKAGGAYSAAKRNRWLDEVCSHMEGDNHLPGYWTKERCIEEASRFTKKSTFRKECQGAYGSAWKNGWLEEICMHMNQTQTRGYWTKERCIEEGKKYSRRSDFRKGGKGAYNAAYTKGWLEEVCAHMDKPYQYTKEECRVIALKYNVERYWRINETASYLQAEKNGWLSELTNHMKKMHRYTKDECRVEALKYTTRNEFCELSPQHYFRACSKNWIQEICQHMKRQGNLIYRKIYVFEFKDNHAYVGLAQKPEEREKEHLSAKNSGVYKYVKETNCPYEFKVLTDFLSRDEAAEQEDIWIKKYAEAGWQMINIRPGGDLGGCPRKYTKEYCTKIAKKYRYRYDFIKGDTDAYEGARRYGYLDEVCAHMKPKRQMPTKDEYREIALKYKTTAEFSKNDLNAYRYIIRHGWFDELCSHLATRHYWTDAEVIAESAKYNNPHEFRKGNPKAYDYAKRHEIMVKCCEQMNKK